jgi:hypothetical protein
MDSNNATPIIKYVIKSTPIGHVKETVENLKNLVGQSAMEEKEILDELQTYEEDHFKQFSLGDDKIIISKFNKDKDNFYHDQAKKTKISVTPLSDNIEKIQELHEAELPHHEFRALLDSKLNEYRDKSYKSGITAINSKYNLYN